VPANYRRVYRCAGGNILGSGMGTVVGADTGIIGRLHRPSLQCSEFRGQLRFNSTHPVAEFISSSTDMVDNGTASASSRAADTVLRTVSDGALPPISIYFTVANKCSIHNPKRPISQRFLSPVGGWSAARRRGRSPARNMGRNPPLGAPPASGSQRNTSGRLGEELCGQIVG